MNTALAILASLAVVLGFSTAVLGFFNQRQIAKAAEKAIALAKVAAATAAEVQTISVNVDGRLSTLIERQAQLLGALHESGTPVPPRPPETIPQPDPGKDTSP